MGAVLVEPDMLLWGLPVILFGTSTSMIEQSYLKNSVSANPTFVVCLIMVIHGSSPP